MSNRFKAFYHRIFAIHEIESSTILQLLFYVLSFSFYATFYNWVERNYISVTTYLNGTHICPPYFQSCGDFYFLDALPYGYSQSALYIFLFLVLGFGVYSAYKKDWTTAHATLLFCFLWKITWAFVLTYGVAGNFDYYDIGLAFVWLFLRHKEYFAKLAFVSFYVLASSIKIDGGWIFSNYFYSLFTGAPVFPQAYLPVFTNFLILMQMVGSWFLLSNNKLLQRSALVYFLLFHTYSGIIVNYRYISVSIPALFVLFSQPGTFRILKVDRSTLGGYAFLLLLLCGQLIGISIPGDQKKTLEGNYYGLYMFEANHQCVSTATTYLSGSTSTTQVRENHVANNRCDPYRYWFPLKTKCNRNSEIERIHWTFDHSINGSPYERIVDVEDACSLEYKPLSHNDWIRIGNDARVVDKPVYKSGYAYDLDQRLKIAPDIVKNDWLLERISKFYWLLWSLSILIPLSALIYVSIKRR